MVSSIPTAWWLAALALMLGLVALMIVGLFLAGQAIDDVGSWRWSTGRPV